MIYNVHLANTASAAIGQRTPRTLKKVAALFISLIFLVFSAMAGIALDMMIWADQPAGDKKAEKVVTIPPGQRFGTITAKLQQAGLLANPMKFRLLARIRGDDKRIRAGEYLLAATLSPREILSALTEGKVRLHRLTVPEGYSMHQIAALIERNGFGDQASFLTTAAEPALLAELGIQAATFEGYLYPETYHFPGTATPRQIITAMVRRFRTVFTDPWRVRAQELGFSVHQIVTLASIIEKETGDGAERAVISSVLHNRLKRRMRLEADPTVIYGIPDFNGNITRKDLETATPYNTYKIRGLPPGPIANPGYASLQAALYPADTRFLYFVSKQDKTHHFSTTFKEHRRAVRKYQLR